MDDLRYKVDLLTAKNQKLINNENMYKLICESSGSAFLFVNSINNSATMLGAWDSYFDFTINEATELIKILDCFEDDNQDDLRRLLFIEKEGKSEQSLEVRVKDKAKWVKVSVNVFFDETGNVNDKLVTFMDTTKHRIRKDELEYMAFYDHLTNLYNRNYFISRLNEFVEKASLENAIVSVMLFDIDDFHKLSDSRGLVTGDEIIQNLGLFINGITETNVIASRFDSDIFCIAIYDPCGHRSVDSIYRSVTEYLSRPIRLTDMTEVSITVSVGVSEYPESTDNALQLINCAEIVMHKAKTSGKNNIKFFDSSILRSFLAEVDIETKLKEAIHDNSFYMCYQPQFYAKNRELRGVEALIRWKDKDGAFISPAVFIPLAERNGSIIQIGDFVIDSSLSTYMEWKKKFDIDITLSINISSVQFTRPDFVKKIMNAVNRYNMNPEKLELEITESVLIEDINAVTQKIEELRDFGIRVSLDDFGTGFSSLSYLRGLPINTLKIDKSFIDNINSDDSSRVIVDSIIDLSKKLGYETVAEGVETLEQLDYLKNISCELIQGFYLGKPLSKEEIEQLFLRLM